MQSGQRGKLNQRNKIQRFSKQSQFPKRKPSLICVFISYWMFATTVFVSVVCVCFIDPLTGVCELLQFVTGSERVIREV